MKAENLRVVLKTAAVEYAGKHGIQIDDSWESACIFQELKDNFQPDSYAAIMSNEEWKERTRKTHQKVKDTLEMQSSNSSDALLMNIFCHPKIHSWKGVSDLIGYDLSPITFGFKPGIHLENGAIDTTEIDMSLPGCFFEAKLTEGDFTKKKSGIVEGYAEFRSLFHTEELPRTKDGAYANYQVIRNLLAANQYDVGHVLLCDERRSDLVREYLRMVSFLKDKAMRKRCRVIFWQELVHACGEPVKFWAIEKYYM